MIHWLIDVSLRNRFLVIALFLLLGGWGYWALLTTPIDAIPDLSDNQVIVFTDWPGRSPQEVEDQITYPLTVGLQGLPGVRVVRSSSAFGFSMINVLFEDAIDIYFARTRVLERLNLLNKALPEGVVPTLGPDASGVGWVYQYVLKDDTGRMDLAELRAFQDFTVRPALQAVAGVAEVASLGGFQRQYQIILDPDRLVGFGLTLGDVTRSVRDANAEVGARVLELAGREYVLRGRGYVKDLADLEKSVVTVGPGGIPGQFPGGRGGRRR